MKCAQIRQQLALNLSGDCDDRSVTAVAFHLQTCAPCRQFQEELAATHHSVRSLRNGETSAASLARVRSDILSRIENSGSVLGWRIRMERFILSSLRRPRYAVAMMCVASFLSVVMFSQLRRPTAGTLEVAELDGDTLRLPERYREWVFIGSSTRLEDAGSPTTFQNVYISPDAYQEYSKSGKFPEGSMMVMETAIAGDKGFAETNGHYEKEFVSVRVSVKDSRFQEGWGYFEFKDRENRAKALPESAGCLACHRDRGATDHVFTQFYPVLRAAAAVL